MANGRKKTQLDRIEEKVDRTNLAIYGGSDSEGKQVTGLNTRMERVEDRVFPPWWKRALSEGRMLAQTLGISIGVHKGAG